MLIKIIYVVTIIILNSTSSWAVEKPAVIFFKVMTLETAQNLTPCILNDCREKRYEVAVSVVDRFGNLQITSRDGFDVGHTPETAQRKAWVAVSFNSDTLTFAEETNAETAASRVRFIANALMLGIGVPVQSRDSILGAIGASGAPSEFRNNECARVGIDSIPNSLEFLNVPKSD